MQGEAKESRLIFKVAFSSLILPSCHASPLCIHLNSTDLGLETDHPPKSPFPWAVISRSEDVVTVEFAFKGWSTKPTKMGWKAKHSQHQPRGRALVSAAASFPSLLPRSPQGLWAPQLCHTTYSLHWPFPLKFQLLLLPIFARAVPTTKRTGSACVLHHAQADVGPVPAWVRGQGRSTGCSHPHTSTACWVHPLPLSCSLGRGEVPHPEQIKYKHYKCYFWFLMLFLTCHQPQLPQDCFCPSVPFYRNMSSCCSCSLLPFVLLAEIYAYFLSGLTKQSRSASWTSHTLECSLLCLGFYFWSGVCMQEHYG